MSKDLLRYDRMVEAAKRSVVRAALREVVTQGGELPGDHHFYLTFRTDRPGVDIPDYLRTKYPQEMTIVLQYQFYDLEVTTEAVSVTLSFGGVLRRLVIPMAALLTFADPSVNFVLQFQPDEDGIDLPDEEDEVLMDSSAPDEVAAEDQDGEPAKGATVVALDAFRKK
ncbi:SspB family protein [Oleisolibacter albus]|uniref:SspB family protein n=1 Tax=Oleisolibacter albus TaxID=2171757 RepID=UPI000DF41425|nr:ClpXP protease specificity-enhancing factor SspB [Oleisolibacter albus]